MKTNQSAHNIKKKNIHPADEFIKNKQNEVIERIAC